MLGCLRIKFNPGLALIGFRTIGDYWGRIGILDGTRIIFLNILFFIFLALPDPQTLSPNRFKNIGHLYGGENEVQ